MKFCFNCGEGYGDEVLATFCCKGCGIPNPKFVDRFKKKKVKIDEVV